MKRYHLITGMPRSGTTLLGAILNQNPQFNAGPSDGLYNLVHCIFDQFNSQNNIYYPLIEETQRKNILRGLFDSFYKHVEKDVCFTTSRGWIFFPHLIPFLDPNMKFICCVREIPLIINSFERLYQKHPTHVINMLRRNNDHKDFASMENRCKFLYEDYLSVGVKIIKEISMSSHSKNFMFIEHEDLCNRTDEKIKEIYDFIGEPYFQHNYNDVATSNKELDLFANCPTLHTTEKVVRNSQTNLLVPKQILDNYNIGKYWN